MTMRACAQTSCDRPCGVHPGSRAGAVLAIAAKSAGEAWPAAA